MEDYNFWQDLFDTYQSLPDWMKFAWLITPPAFFLGLVAMIMRYRLALKSRDKIIDGRPLKTSNFDVVRVISMFRVSDNILKYLRNAETRNCSQCAKERFLEAFDGELLYCVRADGLTETKESMEGKRPSLTKAPSLRGRANRRSRCQPVNGRQAGGLTEKGKSKNLSPFSIPPPYYPHELESCDQE